MKKSNKVTFLTQAAVIAAIYVVLTIIFAPISFGEVQGIFMNIINVEHISKIFGGKVIFDDVSCGISVYLLIIRSCAVISRSSG